MDESLKYDHLKSKVIIHDPAKMMSHIRETHGQAHLGRGKRGSETDGLTAHYSRFQQGKSENAANPRNSATIFPTLLIGQKACQLLIKYSFLSNIPPVVENTRRVNKASSTSRTLSPNSLFYHLMAPIYSRDTGVVVASYIEVKNPKAL